MPSAIDQPDLFTAPVHGLSETDLSVFRSTLALAGGWLTRAQLCQVLGWSERNVRDAAEALGADVVRCQLGFKLTDLITRDDLPAALQACEAFESQSRKMAAYSQALRKRLHARIG